MILVIEFVPGNVRGRLLAMTREMWLMLILVLVMMLAVVVAGVEDAIGCNNYEYTMTKSIPDFGKDLKIKEIKYKRILLQAKRDWGEQVDAPFLARKKYEMDVAIYINTIKEMKLLGIYEYQRKENKEDRAKKSHNRRYR